MTSWLCGQALSIESVLRDDEVVGKVHPAILRLGFKYADGSLRGGNSRAIALIAALRQLIKVQQCKCQKCELEVG